ncbi:HEPN domain-containing protein [Ferrovum myxofaciens]|uniref:HEPN domain-containing protein n=1 Tax=Ferrovum myxofaciens TaxID=416213 RepID=A0A9E6MY21_9PROT|nr:HEPN domain-containing protein [Ferrovum myxofaciens]MBU6994069.1 HEPN domain-containing protein [Ferrovum myxofaciens]QKE38028.1 MAG: HEPN domain-containing protein [Ferrovum myxofaciens]QWY75733.1 MAG: HEPN domain-containing protein [Ferrovum myxofaciens]QWY78463.1 MAG: HEPN domain-containing protein [Ferrovum myxofaciens]
MNSQLDHANGLLTKARDDFFVVRRLAGEADAPGWVLGFHAEQAVEKALKAVLSNANVVYPRTHNLVMLVELLRQAQQTLPPNADELGQLVPYGVVLRYEELPDDDPPLCEPIWFIDIVEQTLAWATASLEQRD